MSPNRRSKAILADSVQSRFASICTSEQRQGLGDEVIVANVRELRAISHGDRKKDQVEVDGMDEEQATKEALETDQSERRQGGLDGCDGD